MVGLVTWQVGTRTLFRTRISYYRDRIIKCQRLFTSYRDVTKARKRALTNKWTRSDAFCFDAFGAAVDLVLHVMSSRC